VVKEIVLQDLVEIRPELRVTIQNFLNQITRLVRNVHVLWKSVVVLLDASISSFHIRCLERRLANNQCVNNDTQRPNVHLVRMTIPAF